MKFKLFDYCNSAGGNEFKAWTQALQLVQRGKLNAKLDMLEMLGDGLLPVTLTGTDTPGILKLRIKGNVQLRPMLCKGPVDVDEEFSLLVGAIEVDSKLKPLNADVIADGRKKEIRRYPDNRRVKHERVS